MTAESRSNHQTATPACEVVTANSIGGCQHVVLFVGWMIAAFWIASQAVGQNVTDAVAPTAYRQIMVPADHPEVWPRDGKKYFPVEAGDFNGWIATANRPPAVARISEAEYVARLDGSRLVAGHGRWSVNYRGREATLLPLDEMSLVVHDPQWTQNVAEPALIGWWSSRELTEAKYALEVSNSGTVEFVWHTLPARRSGGVMEFPLKLPPATMTRLILDLPSDKRPRLEGSVIVEGPVGPDAKNIAARSGNGEPESSRRWVIAMGETRSARLRIEDAENRPLPEPIPTARLESRYRLLNRGLDVETTIELESNGAELRELTVVVPEGVQIVAASADGQNLSWSTTVDSAGATSRSIIQLSAIRPDGQLTISIRAWSALVVDETWRLPVIGVDGAFWTAGSLELELDPTLELKELVLHDCLQTSIDRDASVSGMKRILFLQALSPTASAQLIVAHRRPNARVLTGTTLQIGRPEVTGRLVARLMVDGGVLHKVTAELMPGWSIDAVESVPSDVLGEWYVDGRSKRPQIEVQLDRSASRGQPVTLIITGRLQRSGPLSPIARDTLAIVNWPDLAVERRLLRLQRIEPYELEPVGELVPIASAELSVEEQELFDSPVDERVFDLSASSPEAAVRLSPKRGTYNADVVLVTTLSQRDLRQECSIVCQPRGNGIDHVLVHLSEPSPSDLLWTDADSGERLVAERMPPSDPRQAGLQAGGELWRLELRRFYVRPVSIAASFAVPWSQRGKIPLVSLPEADRQQGRIVIRATGTSIPQITASGMTPSTLPVGLPAGDAVAQDTPTVAVYRYEPMGFYKTGPLKELWLGTLLEKSAREKLIAVGVGVASIYTANGSAQHRIDYRLEDHGTGCVELSLVSGTRLEAANLNGQSLSVDAIQSAQNRIAIPLPPLTQTNVLTVYLRSDQPPLENGQKLRSPLPDGDLTLLNGSWTIWLPSEYSAIGAGVSPSLGRFEWRSRLFGPLARPRSESPFHPFQAEDWVFPSAVSDALPVRTVATPQLVRESRSLVTQASLRAELLPEEVGSHTERATIIDDRMTAGRGAVSDNGLPPIGWHAYYQRHFVEPPQEIRIVHPPSIAAWAFSAFLAFGIGVSLCRLRPRSFVVVAAAAGLLCLLLPAAYAPIATGALLGIAFSPVGSLVRNWTASPGRSALVTNTASSTWFRLLITFGALVSVPTATFAQELLPDTSEKTPRGGPKVVASHAIDEKQPSPSAVDLEATHHVLVPVDDSGKNVGTKYFVDERFLRHLLAASTDQQSPGGTWMLRDMRLRCPLVPRSGSTMLSIGTCVLTFDVDVLERDAAIELPLVESEAEWSPSASIDGIPTPIDWAPEGKKCVVLIREPGRCQMSIEFVPHLQEMANRRRVQLTLPRVLGATVSFESAAAPINLSVEGAQPLPDDRQLPIAWHGELDGSGTFAATWDTVAPNESSLAAGRRVEELKWLYIGSGGVELEARYILRGGDWPDVIHLTADRRWQYLPDSTADSVDEVELLADGRQSIRVHCPQTPEQHDIRLHFRLGETAPFGRLRVPAVDLTSPRADRRLLAVSSDAALESELSRRVAMDAASASDFLSAWGTDEDRTAPQLVLDATRQDGPWSLSVRPRAVVSAISEQLSIAAGAKRLRVLYRADVDPQGVDHFNHSLSIPEDLVVTRVTAKCDDTQVEFNVERAAPDRINIFFAEPLATSYRLTVAGELPVAGFGEIPVPRVSSADHAQSAQTVALFREDDVLAALSLSDQSSDSKRQEEQASVELSPVGWQVHHVATYSTDHNAAGSARIRLSANKVQATGRILTALVRENEIWKVKLVCHLRVDQGALSRLAFRVPSGWRGPVDVKSSDPISVETAGDLATTRIVQFDQPIQVGGTTHFEIEAPWMFENSQQVTVPMIAPLLSGEWSNYVSVPDEIDGEPAAWATSGVERIELPVEFSSALDHPKDCRIFRTIAERMRITWSSPPAESLSASIRLAETATLIGPNGSAYVVTRFIVVPQGNSSFLLRLPDDRRLVRISLNRHPALLQEVDPWRWRVEIGPPNLPQLLEIVTQNDRAVDVDRRTIDLRRATLSQSGETVPVELSLWCLYSPQVPSHVRVSGAALLSRETRGAFRLDRLASILESATHAATESPAADGYNWFAYWIGELESAKEEAQVRWGSPGKPETLSPIVRPAEDSWSLAAARSEAWIQQVRELFLGVDAASQSLDSLPTVGNDEMMWFAPPDGPEWHYFVADGGDDELRIELVTKVMRSDRARLVAVCMVVGLAIVAGWMLRQPTAIGQFPHGPHLAVVVIGLLAWFWLRPIWLGPLLVTAGIFLMIRRYYQAKRGDPDSGTTVVATGKTD